MCATRPYRVYTRSAHVVIASWVTSTAAPRPVLPSLLRPSQRAPALYLGCCMRSTHRGCTHRLRSPSVIAECPCQCHGQGSAFATCDIEGGCGHLHPPDRRCASGVTCVR